MHVWGCRGRWRQLGVALDRMETAMSIEHRIKPKYKTRNEELVAKIRADAGAEAPIDPIVKIKKKASDLALLMALVHGGDWRVMISPDDGFVLVSRRQSQRTP